MQIPKKIHVGIKEYTVLKVKRARHGDTLGTIDYTNGIIWIATHDDRGNKLTKDEMADTFWHEMTHAVLHDMHSPLCVDERFVTTFANRLTNAINSAKL
jgi:hypothetical protein